MGCRTAIGIDDDLAPGEAAIAIRTADEELAGRIDVPGRVLGDPAARQRFLHIGLDQLAHVVRSETLIEMLLRHDDLGRRDRLAVLVLDGDLALGIGSQCFFLAGPARIGKRLQDAMGIIDGRRHLLGRLIAGIAEHDALIAGTFILLLRPIDALRDIGRLSVQQDLDLGVLPVEAVLLVADILDRVARRGFDHVMGHADGAAIFPGNDRPVGRAHRLAGDPDMRRVHALGDGFAIEQVDYLIGYAVAYLVRMSLGNRFAGEKIVLPRHSQSRVNIPASFAEGRASSGRLAK